MVKQDRGRGQSRDLVSPAAFRGDELAPRVATALRRAHLAEANAAGEARREAWRTTRELLGAAIAAGYSARILAECLGVSSESIRTRAERDGWLSVTAVQELTDLDAGALRSWRSAGKLSQELRSPQGVVFYPALDVVRALASG